MYVSIPIFFNSWIFLGTWLKRLKLSSLKLGVMIETIKEFNFMCDLLLFDVTFEQSRLFNFLIHFSVQDPPIVSTKSFLCVCQDY